MSALIEARGLHAHYGESHVLRGVSMAIGAGESIGLLGRNGMGQDDADPRAARADAGKRRQGARARPRLHARGASPHRADGHRLRPGGARHLPEPECARKPEARRAARARQPRRVDYERVLDAFPRLKERLGSGGQQLSGGEQQMLAIGRALMMNPDVLILDEATEGLAPLIVREIWRIIGEIRQSGIASLLVDRNYRLVLANTDRALVMEKGRHRARRLVRVAGAARRCARSPPRRLKLVSQSAAHRPIVR
jgi:branched-chain amino acid transport system ATP-binding protein